MLRYCTKCRRFVCIYGLFMIIVLVNLEQLSLVSMPRRFVSGYKSVTVW